MAYVFRGVHALHPALEAAKRGEVVPAQPESDLTPKEHNLGFASESSPFTSWTKNRERALWHARRQGSDGVLLRVPEGAPGPEDAWTWEWSPDGYGEEEILLRGIRLNAEVEKA